MELNINQQEYASVQAWGADYDIVPPGKYHVKIVNAEGKTAQSGTQYLSLDYLIVEGEQLGKTIQDRLFLWSPEQKLRLVGFKKLKGIAEKSGHQNPNYVQRTEELIGRELMVSVKVGEYNNNQTNEIKGYDKLVRPATPAAPEPQPPFMQNPSTGGYQQQPTAAQSTSAPQGGSDLPW